MSNKSGFISRLFQRNDPAEERLLREVEKRGGIEVVLEAWKSNRASFESSVSPRSSLQVSAVWACVRLISETIGSLPLFIYEETNGEKNRARNHYLYSILHDQPNPAMTAIEVRETLQSHLVLWGNAYSQIIYDARGRVTEIWPLRPDHMPDKVVTVTTVYTTSSGGKTSTIAVLSNGSKNTVIEAKAAGGDVFAGQPVKVGEKGTELFVPPTDGIIIPANQLMNTSNVSNGGDTISVSFGDINISGAQDPKAVAAVIVKEVKLQMANLRR